jgi:hypothetical protein
MIGDSLISWLSVACPYLYLDVGGTDRDKNEFADACDLARQSRFSRAMRLDVSEQRPPRSPRIGAPDRRYGWWK